MRGDTNVYTASLQWINSLHPGDAPGEDTNSARRLSPIKHDNDRPLGS